MTYVYIYRMTHFGGTAPCFDDEKLTLAICKRDMRRVIGNLYRSKKFNENSDEIWFLGIVGNQLAKEDGFKAWKDKVIYAAKVTGVVEFHEYFTKGNDRSDNIYEECTDNTCLSSGRRNFKHKDGNNIHPEQELWERDFDIQHKNSPKYVLKSETYCFIDSKNTDIKEIINKSQKWPTGVGHRRVDDEDNELGKILNHLANIEDNNKKVLDNNIKKIINDKNGCGKGKGANI